VQRRRWEMYRFDLQENVVVPLTANAAARLQVAGGLTDMSVRERKVP
jgi:hypothetical protein